ncbi:MAG: hypothetical protein ALECFALPRED_002326 [Alectoria fallacina]|uniref:Uncharacterized protein n=1 Tax=Alectoria fallacina TaxID=1903189 RepID=A0A8H3FGD9_9LECA|nr:MAG: hypothetical protein ALECFALPRED_002326 [Alectoria fallacina]
MAFRAPPSFCADAVYEKFLSLGGFTPAKSFCSNLSIHQRSIEVAAQLDSGDSVPIAANPHSQRDIQCPAASTLCSLLSELQAADKGIARDACRCIGVYVVVPGITMSEELTTENTTRLRTMHTKGSTMGTSSRDADVPTMESLLRTTSSAENARMTSIASKGTTTSEWTATSLYSASTSPNFSTILGTSSASFVKFHSTSSSISSQLNISSSTSGLNTSSSTSRLGTRKSTPPSTTSSISSSSSPNILPSSAFSRHSTTSATSALTITMLSHSSSIGSASTSPLYSRISSRIDTKVNDLTDLILSSTTPSILNSPSSSTFSSSASSGHSITSATSALTIVILSSSSSIGSSSSSSLSFPTCTYPTATTTCPTVTATGLAYKQYYAGQCYIENAANPGTGSEPAIYTRFRGAYDMCAVSQYCANAARAAYGPYHSFDLHYTCSNSSWMCVQYYNGNSDASYFNVLNSDVAVAFGYSY